MFFGTHVAAVASSRTPLHCARDPQPTASQTALPCGLRSSELLSAPHPFLRSIPSDRAVFRRAFVVAVAPLDLLPDRAAQTPLCSPLSLLPSRAGPGSHELLASTTRRWGSIWHPPRSAPVPPTRASGPMPKGASPAQRLTHYPQPTPNTPNRPKHKPAKYYNSQTHPPRGHPSLVQQSHSLNN